MKPVGFEGQNIVMGKGQPQYMELPALRCDDAGGTVWSCWELDDNDLADLVKHREIWIGQLTFHRPFTPQMVTTVMPGEVSMTVHKARQAVLSVGLVNQSECDGAHVDDSCRIRDCKNAQYGCVIQKLVNTCGCNAAPGQNGCTACHPSVAEAVRP